jgi:rhodanese-related sulfurtransferase
MAGYVAGNIVNGDMAIFHWHQVDDLKKQGAVIVDVRSPREVEQGAIPGTINIPVDDLRNRMKELPQDGQILVYCRVGLRGYIAARILKQNGFNNVKNLSGGYLTYDPAING